MKLLIDNREKKILPLFSEIEHETCNLDLGDFQIIDEVRKNITLPITAIGGAGSLNDVGELIKKYTIIGAGAGSIFVFKGKYRAVLINYPNDKEKMELIKKYMKID